MTRIVAFGDENVERSLYDFPGEQWPFPGLPINDAVLFKAAEKCFNEFDRVFWINSHPLIGYSLLIEQPDYLELEPGKRIVPYHNNPEYRGYVEDAFWSGMELKLILEAMKNHREMTEYIMTKYSSKFVLLPISTFFFDKWIQLPPSLTPPRFQSKWREVNLWSLHNLFNSENCTWNSNLSEEAYRLIEPEILKFTY